MKSLAAALNVIYYDKIHPGLLLSVETVVGHDLLVIVLRNIISDHISPDTHRDRNTKTHQKDTEVKQQYNGHPSKLHVLQKAALGGRGAVRIVHVVALIPQ